MTSLNMDVIWCDDAYANVLHVERHQLIGTNVIDHTHPEDRGFNLKLLDRLRHGGAPFSLTKRYWRAEGASIGVRNHVSASRDGAGEPCILASVEKLFELENDEALMLDRARRAIRRRHARLSQLQRGTLPEGAVDILLDLYANQLLHKPISVSSACLASRVSPTSALRHIERMVAAGLTARRADPLDKRRLWLGLTEEGTHRVETYLRLCET